MGLQDLVDILAAGSIAAAAAETAAERANTFACLVAAEALAKANADAASGKEIACLEISRYRAARAAAETAGLAARQLRAAATSAGDAVDQRAAAAAARFTGDVAGAFGIATSGRDCLRGGGDLEAAKMPATRALAGRSL